MNIEVMVSTGGTSLKEDIMRLYSKVHILVATPGRVLDLANKRVADLSSCTTIVMDEVCAPSRSHATHARHTDFNHCLSPPAPRFPILCAGLWHDSFGRVFCVVIPG